MTQNRKSKEKALLRVQDILWMLSSLSQREVKDMVSALEDFRNYTVHGLYYELNEMSSLRRYSSENSNKNFLVGVLPKFLRDLKVFPENKDVASFSENVFGISVPRYEKKSRFEVIGTIVCSIAELEDEKFERIVRSIAKIVNDEMKIDQLALEKQRTGFSWNDAIRKLADDI